VELKDKLKNKLKLCPFCGGDPDTWWDYNEPYYEDGYNIQCCFAHVKSLFKQTAIEDWNKRI